MFNMVIDAREEFTNKNRYENAFMVLNQDQVKNVIHD